MMESQEKGLEGLELWQVAIAFAHKVYLDIIPVLPAEERWAMANQLRRAVQSISANIAEGYWRYYYQDNVRFCYIARGSLEETYSHIALAKRLAYITDDQYSQLVADINRLRRLLNGYIAYLKASKRGASEPGVGLFIQDSPENYQVNDISEINPGSPITDH